jgi:uncharacterized membrane protein YfcA
MGLSVAAAGPIGLLAVGMAAALGVGLGLKAGTVRYKAALLMAGSGILFSPLGTWLARRMDNRWLGVLFAVVLLFVAYRTFQKAQAEAMDSESVPDHYQEPLCIRGANNGRFVWTIRCARALALSGTAAGFLSGLLGVGGALLASLFARRRALLAAENGIVLSSEMG